MRERRTDCARVKTLRLSLKRRVPARAARSKWPRRIWVCTPYISTLRVTQIGKKESIEDTARVLGRMFDGIEYRGYGQEIAEELAKYAGVPVWNGLTNEFHPTQILADFMTVKEKFGSLRAESLCIWATHVTIWAIRLWSVALRRVCASSRVQMQSISPTHSL